VTSGFGPLHQREGFVALERLGRFADASGVTEGSGGMGGGNGGTGGGSGGMGGKWVVT